MRAIICWATGVLAVGRAQGQTAPVADHHQHLFSPATAALISTANAPVRPITARDLVALLDSAGIRRAVVLSMGYTWGSPNRTVEHEYEKVKAENDWTSRQVAEFPDRLRGFCSFNPLRDYALTELSRCAKDSVLRRGLKLHLANSVVDYHNAGHIEQLKRVFRAANANGMPIVVHVRSSISRGLPYGANETRIVLNELVPAAPDVGIQIAHLAGAGSYDFQIDSALAVFADAISQGDRRTRNLWFDATIAVLNPGGEMGALVAKRLRQVGLERVLFGSDAAVSPDRAPKALWSLFRQLPLTEREFEQIAKNAAPWAR